MLTKRNPFQTLRSPEQQLKNTTGNDSQWLPRVDVYEESGDLVFECEASGLDQEDFDVALDGRHLVISGERMVEGESGDRDYRRSERVYGTFKRAFTLPGTVRAEDIEAEYSDGLLTVRVPSSDSDSSTKRIKVE